MHGESLMGSGGEAHESAGTGGARRERSASAEGGQGAEARRGVHMWAREPAEGDGSAAGARARVGGRRVGGQTARTGLSLRLRVCLRTSLRLTVGV